MYTIIELILRHNGDHTFNAYYSEEKLDFLKDMNQGEALKITFPEVDNLIESVSRRLDRADYHLLLLDKSNLPVESHVSIMYNVDDLDTMKVRYGLTEDEAIENLTFAKKYLQSEGCNIDIETHGSILYHSRNRNSERVDAALLVLHQTRWEHSTTNPMVILFPVEESVDNT
jgi:hypothetical protein